MICFKRGKLPPLCLQGTVTCHHDENVQSRSSENYPHTLLKSRRQDNHFFSVSLSECLTRRWKAHHCVWPQNPFIRETTLKSSDFTLFHQRHCCAASCLPKTATEPTDNTFKSGNVRQQLGVCSLISLPALGQEHLTIRHINLPVPYRKCDHSSHAKHRMKPTNSWSPNTKSTVWWTILAV